MRLHVFTTIHWYEYCRFDISGWQSSTSVPRCHYGPFTSTAMRFFFLNWSFMSNNVVSIDIVVESVRVRCTLEMIIKKLRNYGISLVDAIFQHDRLHQFEGYAYNKVFRNIVIR